MGNSQEYEFSPEQHEALGQLVVDHWGWNISQTGMGLNAIPYIYFQRGPNDRPVGFDVFPDGTVVKLDDDDESDPRSRSDYEAFGD